MELPPDRQRPQGYAPLPVRASTPSIDSFRDIHPFLYAAKACASTVEGWLSQPYALRLNWEALSGRLRGASTAKHVAISIFGILHAEGPESGRGICFLEEGGTDKGNFAIHANVPLTFNAEAGKPVTCELCHDIA